MYLIREKHVNGVHSFWKIRNKLIPTIKLAEQIKTTLEMKSLDDGSLMVYEIEKMDIIDDESEFYDVLETEYIEDNVSHGEEEYEVEVEKDTHTKQDSTSPYSYVRW